MKTLELVINKKLEEKGKRVKKISMEEIQLNSKRLSNDDIVSTLELVIDKKLEEVGKRVRKIFMKEI